jgi:hypothetical protein
MDFRIRLVGDKGAIEGGEGEAREVVGALAVAIGPKTTAGARAMKRSPRSTA